MSASFCSRTHRPAGSSGSPEPLGTQPPDGPLDIAQRAFDLLVTGPGALTFDGRGIPGLPARHLRLGELRRLLLARGTTRATHDRVWAHLLGRARRDGGAWILACAGIAMPGLKARAAALARGWVGDPADLDSELLTGFLEGMRALDLESSRICAQLIGAGAAAVRRSRYYGDHEPALRGDSYVSARPLRPWDHPDLVLARALEAGVIDAEQHLLIGATRLGGASLAQVAECLQVSAWVAAKRRRDGERDLAEAIGQGQLSEPTVRRRRTRG